MNDYEKFTAFLKSMGILFGTPDRLNTESRHGDEPMESIYRLTVSQAIFCFDKDKKYIGVVSDEMGFFEERIK